MDESHGWNTQLLSIPVLVPLLKALPYVAEVYRILSALLETRVSYRLDFHKTFLLKGVRRWNEFESQDRPYSQLLSSLNLTHGIALSQSTVMAEVCAL